MRIKASLLVFSILSSFSIAFASTPEDIANYLSGKDINDKQSFYTTYSKEVSNSWDTYYKKQFLPIEKWRENNPIKDGEVDVVFYPFSGPDIAHAFTFYPKAKKYILFGLEPVGNIPDIENVSLSDKNDGIKNLKQAVSGVLGRNFFITFDMQKEIKKSSFNNIPSVLLFFLKNLNNQILSVENLTNNGVSIKFKDKNQLEHEVIYYSWDISNKGLDKHPERVEVLKQVTTVPKTLTMLKAASYLCWNAEFSNIRNFILNTDFIMSDVSGMPIKYMKDNKYQISVQGLYLGPITSFKWAVDEDLKKLVQGNKSLPFKYSYSTKGESHLIFARKTVK